MTRLNVTKVLRFDSGVKVGFDTTLWYEQGKFIRQRISGSGIGERFPVTSRHALKLIKQNYSRV